MTKKLISLLIIILIAFNICGCRLSLGPSLSGFSYLLPGDYVLARGSANSTSIYGKDGIGLIVGSSNVTGIAWNKDFILAQQSKLVDTDGRSELYYWIIEVATKAIYGPYSSSNPDATKVDFDNKCKELGIDLNLKLEPPEKYMYLDKSD